MASSPRPTLTVRAAPSFDPYADLAPIGRAIGSAQVVALGDPTHANGNIFAANARIVAYLHERLGFTVLAWEAGLWSCETDPHHCLGQVWGAVQETRPLRALGPSSGIHVTGIDFQFTGLAPEASAQTLHRTLARVLSSNPALVGRLDRAFARFPKYRHFAKLTAAERSSDREAFREVLVALAGRSDVPDLALVMHAVENVVGLYDWHEAVAADVSTSIDWNHHTELNNVRDRAMAENVLWLLRTRYPGQRIILWVANLHAARHPELLADRGPEFEHAFVHYSTMGTWLGDALESSYYVLAPTAYEGAVGHPPIIKEWNLAPAEAGSLEALFLPVDAPFRFVALAEAPSPISARFVGLSRAVAPWAEVFDGALVFRTVTPATPEPEGSQDAGAAHPPP